MMPLASKVLSTVNAPYGASLSACQLAACISDLGEMQKAYGPTFAFYTEVKPEDQLAFIKEMGVSEQDTKTVAQHIAGKVPYPITLAAYPFL